MLIKLDENATDVNMAINDNAKEPGETNQNEVHDYKHVTVPEKINFTPGSPNAQSTLSKTSRSSRSNFKSSSGVTHTRKNRVTITSST